MDNYVGTIMWFAGNYTIQGFLPCDGRLLPIAQYYRLFSLLGTRFGGDGQTTFALPDLPPPPQSAEGFGRWEICITGNYPPLN